MVGAVLMAAAACRPKTYHYVDELDAVVTVQNPQYSTDGMMTYYLDETVVDLSDFVSDPIEIDHDKVDPVILGSIEQNMDSLGWTAIDDMNAADAVIVAGVVVSENWVWYSYWWYDWWWWYYPPVAVPVSYPSGSVVITMVDPNEPIDGPPAGGEDPQQGVPVVWAAGIQGLLRSTTSADLRALEAGIDQAYDQSPYLEVTQ